VPTPDYSKFRYAARHRGISISYARAANLLGADPRSPIRGAVRDGATEVLNAQIAGAHAKRIFFDDPNVRRRTNTSTAKTSTAKS
jgi:hypothetical protein